jgi:hypothetical protein
MPVVPSRYESSFASPGIFEAPGEQPAPGPPPPRPVEVETARLREGIEAGPVTEEAADITSDRTADVTADLAADRTAYRSVDRPSAPKLPAIGLAVAFTNRETSEPAAPAAFDGGKPARHDRVPVRMQELWTDSAAQTHPEIQAEPEVQATLVTSDNRQPEPAIAQHLYSVPVRSVPAAERSPEAFPRRREGFETRNSASEQPIEVHVTIGHIELRQAAPPAPPRQRPAMAQHVRLSDYLKRRSGDTR